MDDVHLVPALLHTTIGVLLIVWRGGVAGSLELLSSAMSDVTGVPRGDAQTQRSVGRLVFATLGTIGLLTGVAELLDAFAILAR